VALVAVACVITAIVATGVIGLRWHYFTDTVAGAAVGLGTVCALALLLDLAWRRFPFSRAAEGTPAVRTAVGAAETTSRSE
jgi:membrane-associated phospholipid phosphatase